MCTVRICVGRALFIARLSQCLAMDRDHRTSPKPAHTVIHLTINRTEHDQDFIDSIQQFVADWKTGLEAHW